MGKTEHFEGKRSEKWHPLDRKSGTGRGKRDMVKEGYGKGNWGTPQDEARQAIDTKDIAPTVEEEETTIP